MSAPITEAHYDPRRQVIFSDADEGAQLIADSEARATERLRKEIDWLQLNNDMLGDDPEKHARAVAERQAIIDERDELRGALAKGQQNCDDAYDDLRAERDQLRAEVERLNADGAASAFVNMSCRASRAETDRNNLRADLDAIKAILNEEQGRAERAEAELADERARLDAVVANCWAVHSEAGSSFSVFNNVCGDYIATAQTYRAAIDAAMKEGA
jgi:DNA repair exonuclease SbcCD ATPase subunit